MLKWAGALAAVGVVGVGLGFGGDILIRPSTTTTSKTTQTNVSTATQTVTHTVTSAPVSLSYKPPLSPEVQTRVNAIISDRESLHAGEQVTYTACNQNGCFAACVLKVHMKNGVVTAFEPDDTINPNLAREDAYIQPDQVNQLMTQLRPCQRGYTWMKDLYAPTLLLYPMKNIGERGPNAKFVRISWDEALTTIAQNMQTTIAKYGKYSIGYGRGFMKVNGVPAGNYIGAGHAEWGLQSFPGHAFAELMTLGVDWNNGEATGNHTQDFFNSKLIVLWGWDALNTFYENAYYLLLAKEKGIPIIVFEPTYSWTVEAVATQWIPIRPSTDIAMMLAVAYVLFKENLYDTNFVSTYVEPTGFQKWQDYVTGKSDATPKTPQWAETICGVPADTITAFAHLYAKSKPVYMRYHWGPARAHGGENNSRIGIYLQAMTGNIGIPGSFCSGVGFNFLGGGRLLTQPYIDTGSAATTYQAPILANGNCEARSIVIRDQLDSGKLTLAQYNAQIGNLATNPALNIHLLGPFEFFGSVSSANSYQNTYDVNMRISALKKVDFVWNVFYHSNSMLMWYSDIILPLANPFFYDHGFSTPFNDVYGNYFIYHGKMADLQGEQRTGQWISTQLAAKLGVGDKVNPKLQNLSLEQWDSVLDQLYKEAYVGWTGSQSVKDLGIQMPSWDEFVKKPIIRIPNKTPFVGLSDKVKGTPNFNTPSKKIEFYSDFIAKGPQYRATTDFRGRCYGDGDVSPMGQYLMPQTGYLGQGAATYPLYLMTPHSYYRQHSSQDSNPLMRDEARHAVWMSVADAKARGIKDNDPVHVYNDAGEIILPAYVTSRIVPGTVIVRFGTWYEPSQYKTAKMPDGVDMRGAANFLIKDDYYGLLLGIDFASSLVQVEKFTGTASVSMNTAAVTT